MKGATILSRVRISNQAPSRVSTKGFVAVDRWKTLGQEGRNCQASCCDSRSR